MNKAFEKILDRLEDELTSTKTKCGTNVDFDKGICKSQEIVQEVAEEYNGGWITCSERLPNQDGEFTDVLITCESMADGIFVQSAEFYITSYGEPVFDALYHYKRVLAWKPLPEPFKECD